MKHIDQATVIKFAAVLTAAPRWIVALLAAEGLALPAEWAGFWIIFSVLSAAGMALVEGAAFAFVFNAWKRQPAGRVATRMLGLALFSAVLFILLLTPSIAASVRGVSIGLILDNDGLLVAWSAVVAASTISVVASVGYAQKQQAGGVVKEAATTANAGANGRKSSAGAANGAPVSDVALPRGTYDDFVAAMAIRNGSGPMTVAEVMAGFGVPERTAYRWLEKYKKPAEVQDGAA